MTDLRKAAQDVLDQYYKDKSYLSVDIDGDKIKALREALQAEPEPVAWIYEGEPSFDGKNWHVNYQLTTSKNVAMFKSGTIKKPTPLYTTPQPNQVQALIAEIDGLERIDFDEGGCDYPCSDGDNYRFDDVRAVLNKYRGVK